MRIDEFERPGRPMTEAMLLDRIKGGEGPLCEFKRAAQPDEIRKAIVAFANTVRGQDVAVLFLGVMPDGRPSGFIQDPDATQRKARACATSCCPPVDSIQIMPLTVSDRNVVAVMVGESKAAPHFTGPAYRRMGSESVNATTQMLSEMIADRIEPARLLRPWIGKDVHVIAEYYPIQGRRVWPEQPASFRLDSVDAQGAVLSVDGVVRIRADWKRTSLQPGGSGETPILRVALD